MNTRITWWALTLCIIVLAASLLPSEGSVAAPLSQPSISTLLLPSSPPRQVSTGSSRYFPETGKTVGGVFLDYWNSRGGLTQQGYPISNEIQERSDTDGKVYTTQYFERAVFELHPEYKAPNNVLLSLLGVFLYKQKYPNGAPDQKVSTVPSTVLFSVTGKHVGGDFLQYWLSHGGLAQQGFPISEEFTEVNDLDHKPYKVQYFERAVFEWHPENEPPYDILLSQLGTFRYKAKHPGSRSVFDLFSVLGTQGHLFQSTR